MATRLTARDHQLRAITERDFQTWTEGILRQFGWRYYHAPDNKPVRGANGKSYVQNIRAGFPDICAVRGDRLIFIELKRELGKESQDQVEWAEDLKALGRVEVYLWRPSDREAMLVVLK